MSLQLSKALLEQIHHFCERSYPEEGAGFLLGTEGHNRIVQDVFPLTNAREDAARSNRYLLRSEDYMKAEREAERRALELIGVFHSHPDHPSAPSEFDREWAQPHFSYLITRVKGGRAIESRSWRLAEDRTQFAAEEIAIVE